MLAYELFLPLSASGFGLGSGVTGIWPSGLLVFVVYFAWASIFGILTLIALRFLPTNLNGFVLSAGSLLVFVVIVILLMTSGKWTIPAMPQTNSPPTLIPTLPTLTANLSAVSTATSSPEASPTLLPTPVIKISTVAPATDTPTVADNSGITSTVGAALTRAASEPLTALSSPITLTIEPTPIYARVDATEANGANLRQDPNGKFILELDNGSIVEVQADTQDVNGVVWAHVIAIRNNQRYEGWVLQSVLETATPIPNWSLSSTPTSAPADTGTPTIPSTP